MAKDEYLSFWISMIFYLDIIWILSGYDKDNKLIKNLNQWSEILKLNPIKNNPL